MEACRIGEKVGFCFCIVTGEASVNLFAPLLHVWMLHMPDLDG